MAQRALEIIDADGHYLEPPDGLADYMPAAYRGLAPRVEKRRDGTEWWEGRGWWDDNPGYRRATGLVGLAGVARWKDQDMDERRSMNYEDANRAAHDPHARLEVLDEEGFDASVVYPSQSLVWVKDRTYHEVLLRALNDWLADWVSADPHRLYGVVNLSVIQDVSWAANEVRRCVEDHGFKAVCIRSSLARPDLHWWDRDFDQLWATCQELDVPVSIHPAAGDTSYGASRAFDMSGTDPIRLFLRTPFANPVDAMNVIGGLIAGGVLERFPKLRVGILESGGSWLPAYLERLDERFEHVGRGLRDLSMTPSDYFRRQCWISFDPEECGLVHTARWIGADRIIWGSDFPHPDAFYPGMIKLLEDNMTELTEEEQHMIMRRNAGNYYKLG